MNLRETIYGDSSYQTSLNGSGLGAFALKETVPATGITDIEVAYKITPQIKLSIGANNLFDQVPPKAPTVLSGTAYRPENGNVFGVPYAFSPYGIDGGYYFGRVTVTF